MTSLPETEVRVEGSEKRSPRRDFSAEYKLQIVTQANACGHGELGALLRREGLYNSQVRQWRKELAKKGAAGLRKTAPGPAPKLTPEQRRIAELERMNAKLSRRLDVAESCIALQKKVLSMLDQANSEPGA